MCSGKQIQVFKFGWREHRWAASELPSGLFSVPFSGGVGGVAEGGSRVDIYHRLFLSSMCASHCFGREACKGDLHSQHRVE